MLGGTLGSALVLATHPHRATLDPPTLGAQFIPDTTSLASAFVAEVWGTFVLLTVVFSLAVDPRGWGKLAPLGISLTVALLLYTIGPITSCAVNPARALGPAITLGYWSGQWVFLVAPPIGAVAAALTWAHVFMKRKEESPAAPSFCPKADGRPYTDDAKRERALSVTTLKAEVLAIDSWVVGPPPKGMARDVPMLLDFFDPGCAPCEASVPRIAGLTRRYAQRGV